MATPRLGLVVEDKPTELSCTKTAGLFRSIPQEPRHACDKYM